MVRLGDEPPGAQIGDDPKHACRLHARWQPHDDEILQLADDLHRTVEHAVERGEAGAADEQLAGTERERSRTGAEADVRPRVDGFSGRGHVSTSGFVSAFDDVVG